MVDSRNSDEPLDVKIFETRLSDEGFSSDTPGDIMIIKDRLFVSTGSKPVEIISLQPAGKKRMNADAFLRGYKPEKFI